MMEECKSVDQNVQAKMALDPGNLMIVIYLLVICLVLLAGTLTNATVSNTDQEMTMEATHSDILALEQGYREQ